MIYLKQDRTLLLHLRNPHRVAAVIPSARLVQVNGASLLAVPHNATTIEILKSVGINPPELGSVYEWPGGLTPFEVQRKTASFLVQNKRAFVLNEMGTGKTAAALWAYDILRRSRDVRRALVVSPLSTLQRTWGEEIFKNFSYLKYSVLHGSREKRLTNLSVDADVYLINHHGIATIVRELEERDDIDIVIIDEVATFRTPSARMWKMLHRITSTREWVWGMTGTPTPTSPENAYGQVKLVNPKNVPRSFVAFRDMVMLKVSQFTWVPRSNAMDVVANVMQPAIRITRDQCFDLPPVIYTTRDVLLTKEQEDAYSDMHRTLVADLKSGQVVALNEAVKVSKLVQIACGVVYDGSGRELTIDCSGRIAVVEEVIEEASNKFIVFCPYRSVTDAVYEALSKRWNIGKVTGDTPLSERTEIFYRLQRDKSLHGIVAVPQTMSHGLTLTEASTIIWYAPVTSNEVYRQANGRITRPGQRHTQLIVNLAATPVERALYRRLESQEARQIKLLELLAAT